MTWAVFTVTSRMEIDVTRKINSAGFVAHCPTFVHRSRIRMRGRVIVRTKIMPLFSGYTFIRPDASFRKDIFEDSKTWLAFLPYGIITEEQMTGINAIANKLTLEASRTGLSIVFKRDEIVQVLHSAMAGRPVKVLEVLKKGNQLRVQFTEDRNAHPFIIDADSVAKAV